MKKTIVLLVLTCLIFSCQEEAKNSPETIHIKAKEAAALPLSFSEKVTAAHGGNVFSQKEALSFDIVLNFGGKERLRGEMTLSTDSRQGIIEYTDGTRLEWSDGEVKHDKDISESSARFSAYTWSYFALMPYKLNDKGTIWTDYPNKVMGGKEYDVKKLSFEDGVGDASEDWYVVYADKQNHLMSVAAYIVTAGGTVEEAEKDPHAIKYSDYVIIDGVPIATAWTFWGWTADDGLTDKLGEATITNPDFITLEEDAFELIGKE